jgi:uncharacterized membrane protein YdjX (TVP38/TMEM64 family)
MSIPDSESSRLKTVWLPWLGAGLVVVLLLLLWQPLSTVAADPQAVRVWIEGLGPGGPLAFFALNVAQIVVAPIPGYPVQVLGGVLFGFVAGSLYTIGGMVTGGVLAAWLGRRLGRPWLERRLGAETLQRWSQVAHIDSFWVWWIILLIPLGDIPYFLAGLSQIRLRSFALAILLSRGPFTLLIVWLGHRVTSLPLTWITLFMMIIGGVMGLGFSQAERIESWGRAFVSRQNSQLRNEIEPDRKNA